MYMDTLKPSETEVGNHEHRLNILAIDDDADVPWQIEILLKESQFDWSLKSISGGDHHIFKKIEETEFDLLLLDHEIGSINGIDIIKQVSQIRSKPIVILTNYDDPVLMRGYLENGAIAFMIKSELTAGYLERSLIYAYRNWVNKKLLSEINDTIALSERLSTTSTMAQGIAHQYNNGLAIISGNLELLERKLSNNPDCARLLAPIQDTVRRLSHLTLRMSTIFTERAQSIENIEVNAYLQKYVENMENEYPDILFSLSEDNKSVRCHADKEKLQAVLNEITQNSIESMWSNDLKRIDIHLSHDDDNVTIHLQDNGIGLQADPEQAMRPFVTTKGAFSRGLDDTCTKTAHGLGLTLVQSLLYDMGGAVQLQNRTEQGSIASIILPITRTP